MLLERHLEVKMIDLCLLDGFDNGVQREYRVRRGGTYPGIPQSWLADLLWERSVALSSTSSSHNHYFFVDTFMTPERSIWVHPLDDPEFLRQHPEYKKSSDSEFAPPAGPPPPNGQASGSGAGTSRSQFSDPITHAHPSHQERIRQAGERAAEEARNEPLPTGLKKATRVAKDKSTGKDHVARARERAEKKETEQIAEEEERRTAQAFQRAASTGQAQYLGQSGKSKLDYWAEPPAPYYPPQWLRVWPPPLSFEARQEGQKVFLRPASPGGYGRGYGGGVYGRGYGYGPGIGMGGLGLLGGGLLMGGLLF